MILERVMRRLRCRRILNNMKKEINKLMGFNMMMKNVVMVWSEEMWSKDKGLSGEELNAIL
jgi:hypothetical protein